MFGRLAALEQINIPAVAFLTQLDLGYIAIVPAAPADDYLRTQSRQCQCRLLPDSPGAARDQFDTGALRPG